MKWSKDTTKLKHLQDYLVYYDGPFASHSIQTYIKYNDEEIDFTGEGFYILDTTNDIWNRCYKQPKYFRELDIPDLNDI